MRCTAVNHDHDFINVELDHFRMSSQVDGSRSRRPKTASSNTIWAKAERRPLHSLVAALNRVKINQIPVVQLLYISELQSRRVLLGCILFPAQTSKEFCIRMFDIKQELYGSETWETFKTCWGRTCLDCSSVISSDAFIAFSVMSLHTYQQCCTSADLTSTHHPTILLRPSQSLLPLKRAYPVTSSCKIGCNWSFARILSFKASIKVIKLLNRASVGRRLVY